MKTSKKRVLFVGLAALFLLFLCVGGVYMQLNFSPKGEKYAQKRILNFANEVNYNKPENVYTFLNEELRELCTKEQFAENFAHERTYPYLTPYWINFLSIEISEDKMSGVAHFSMAARLPGQTVDVPFVYENGNYFVDLFRNIADGSYIKIFDRF